MLKYMRDSSQSFIIYVLFGMLVFVFAVSFGPGSGSCGGVDIDYAAKVDGDIIRRQDFALIYRSQLDYVRNKGGFGAGLGNERLQNELRRQVIDQLIETRLLTHEADRLGLTVSDDELLEYLQSRYGVTQVDFSDYERWVNRNFDTTVTKFEKRSRGDVVATRLQRVLRDNVAVSDDEIKADYLHDHDRVMLEAVRFDPKTVASAAPRAEEIDALLADHADEVQKRFDRDVFMYRTPKQVRARQILKKLPANASDADIAKAKGELVELKNQIDGGADFAALAQTASDDDATKAKGGDMGFIKRGYMAKAIVDALFAMKSDEITKEPLRSPQGLHLMQVTEIKPPARKDLKDVDREVATTLLEERTRDAATEREAKAFLAKLQKGRKLETLTWTEEERRDKTEAEHSGAGKPVRIETPWIVKGQNSLPGIGQNAELATAIFTKLSKEKPLIDKPYKVGRYYWVATLKDREHPDLAKFDSEKDNLREQALWDKRTKVYKAWIKSLRGHAKVELNPELFPPTDAGA